ncbi:hypothetical protein EWM64_g1076 [Hericium alpestre]|uniref:Uncharacterized protein n=1 Tax=Hericium alpestre TaxID=135208 RepID=A0A4Z0ABG4_9AGAM|nr:hypothetical protein EWM64_g1076 [Hericium alpestre]
MHITPKHLLVKRQGADPLALPSGDGIGSGTIAPSSQPTNTQLLTGQGSGVPSSVFLPLASGTLVELPSTSSVLATTSPTSPPAPAQSPPPSGSGSSLSTGAVIGICVGAAAVLAALVLLVRWILKRTTPKPRPQRPRDGLTPSSASRNRNAQGEDERRRSKLEPWSKLGEDDDRWEGMAKPDASQEKDMAEKAGDADGLRMFNKTPSLRSVSEEKGPTSDGHNFDMSTMPNFAKYHPDLAKEFASAPPQRPFVGRTADDSPVVSWDGETAHDSFLSLGRSSNHVSADMSPTTVMARQTPPATVSHPHYWESAEVLTMDEAPSDKNGRPSGEQHNPFADEIESRRTVANPFFAAHADIPRSRSNPFADNHSVKTRSRRSTVTRRSDVSEADTVRAGQAINSLLAALNGPDEPGNRDTIRSSMVSTSVESAFMTAENASISNFPIPPSPKAM